MSLHLASGLDLPREAVTQTFAVLAKRGAGKTYLTLVMVEEMLKAGLHVVIADPVGVTWGLRASADGKREGLPIVVLGGDHGDLPLAVESGALVASAIIDEQFSAVLDLSLLRKGEQVRFMTDFAETLYHKNRAPLHLVLDEADAFAPQKPMKGQERMLGAVEDLVRRGRARGIGITLTTQRAAVLNKDVLTQVEVLVALRTIAPQDRDAIDAWIRVHGTPAQREQLMSSLPSLPIGTAWFWSPGWLDMFKRVVVRKRETFDSSATPTMGQKVTAPKQLAAVDLELLKTRMASTIEKAKADDPKELRRQIAKLSQELNIAKRLTPAPSEPIVKEVPVLPDKDVKFLAALVRDLKDDHQRFLKALDEFSLLMDKVVHAPSRHDISRHIQRPHSAKADSPGKTAHHDSEVGNSGLRRMLIALAQRQTGLTKRQIGIRAGLSSQTGTFSTYLSKARSNGWMTDQGGVLFITDAGLSALGDYMPLPTGKELLHYWLSELGESGAGRMLQVLATAYPDSMSKERLGAEANLSPHTGTFSTYLSKLRALQLIEGGRELKASEELFS